VIELRKVRLVGALVVVSTGAASARREAARPASMVRIEAPSSRLERQAKADGNSDSPHRRSSSRLGALDPTGVQERGKGSRGFSRNLGGPVVSVDEVGGTAETKDN
jgi:hypothetical protein